MRQVWDNFQQSVTTQLRDLTRPRATFQDIFTFKSSMTFVVLHTTLLQTNMETRRNLQRHPEHELTDKFN